MAYRNPPSTAQVPAPAFHSGGQWRPWAALGRWWRRRGATQPAARRLSLALQGGGAHGAFTWGVLDALLQEPSLEFDALSGSSAGAVNAVLMAQGWLRGGREGARQALSDFWLEVGQQMPWPLLTQGTGEDISLSAAAKLLTQWMGLFAPGHINPLGLNPLRDLLERHIDFESIRRDSPFALYVGATHVNTGRLRLFREHELQRDMLLASACLPKIHHTVEVDGQPFWDGGYSANPAVFPLLQSAADRDVLLILLSPRQQDAVGPSMEAIETRIQELGFTTHFLREMQLLASAARAGAGPARSRFHLIDGNHLELLRRSDTKLLAHTPFLELLRDHGRASAQAWLQDNLGAIGRRSTLDWSHWA